jgi:hypothetical protein
MLNRTIYVTETDLLEELYTSIAKYMGVEDVEILDM